MPTRARQSDPTSSATVAAEARTEARTPASAVLALQRVAGNRAVTALLRRRRLQRRPLLESDYPSLAALRKEISIVQTPGSYTWSTLRQRNVYTPAKVEVSYPKSGFKGVNELNEGTVGEAELKKAAGGGYDDKAALAWAHPELVWHKSSLAGIEKMSYTAKNLAGSAIGKVSNAMAANITKRKPRPNGTTKETQAAIENMFLHVFGQAIITTMFGRAAADLVGDSHERDQPALIVGGTFTAKTERQAIDNYCDLINNLHGQEWGETLSKSLGVDGSTLWTPTTTALYATELQKLVAADMGWTMTAFTATHPEIVKFTNLLNEIAGHVTPAGTAAAGAAAGTAAGKAAAKKP